MRVDVILWLTCLLACGSDKGQRPGGDDTGTPTGDTGWPCWYTDDCQPLDICGNGVDDDANGLVDEDGCSIGFAWGDRAEQSFGQYLAVDPHNPAHWAYGGDASEAWGTVGTARADGIGGLSVGWKLNDPTVSGHFLGLATVNGESWVSHQGVGAEGYESVVLGHLVDAAGSTSLELVTEWQIPHSDSEANTFVSMDLVSVADHLELLVGLRRGLAVLIDSPETKSSDDLVRDGKATFYPTVENDDFGAGVGLMPGGGVDGDMLAMVSSFDEDRPDATIWFFSAETTDLVSTDDAIGWMDLAMGEGGYPRPAGDLDNDGYADLILDSGSRSKFLFFGPFVGEQNRDDAVAFGTSDIDPIGDIDGDGHEDILATTAVWEHSLCIIYGPLPHTTMNLDEEGELCLGTDLAFSRATFADVTGDGVGEIVASLSSYSTQSAEDVGLLAAFPLP